MKKVINKKIYTTETAELIHQWDNGCYGDDFQKCEEALYVTKKGSYFIAGSGGPMSRYAVSCGNNNTSGSSDIRTLSKNEAINWLEEHGGSEALEQYFPDALEEA